MAVVVVGMVVVAMVVVGMVVVGMVVVGVVVVAMVAVDVVAHSYPGYPLVGPGSPRGAGGEEEAGARVERLLCWLVVERKVLAPRILQAQCSAC